MFAFTCCVTEQAAQVEIVDMVDLEGAVAAFRVPGNPGPRDNIKPTQAASAGVPFKGQDNHIQEWDSSLSTASSSKLGPGSGVAGSQEAERTLEKIHDWRQSNTKDRSSTNGRPLARDENGGCEGEGMSKVSTAVSVNVLHTVTDTTNGSRLPDEFNPHHGLKTSKVWESSADWTEDFENVQVIGRGGFGEVHEVRRKKDRKTFAIKVLSFENARQRERTEMEFDALSKMKHPNIVSFYALYRGAGEAALVMDLCRGGSLYDKVIATKETILGQVCGGLQTTNEVVPYAWQMLAGLAYLHHYGFAHRDVKLENYMIYRTEEYLPELKLIDFGLCSRIQPGQNMHSKVGTTHYIAPEVLSGEGYTELCDVWSFGVCLFLLSTATFPFYGKDNETLVTNIVIGEFDFDDGNWQRHAKELKDIIKSILCPAHKRPSALTLLESRWLRQRNGQLSCCTIA